MEDIKRAELVHKYPGMKDEEFFAEIDRTGGWPVGYRFVQFFHSSEYSGRVCIFTNNGINTGWWTTVASADDYYWWKLSSAKKAEVVEEARRQLIRQLQLMRPPKGED